MLHNRQSIRLKKYDYSLPGAYFVTVCTHRRQFTLGQIVNVGAGPRGCPQMILNNIGQMVDKTWNEIPNYYHDINIDVFQIMPNHIHGILIIDKLNVQTLFNGQPRGVAPTTRNLSLSDIVHRFKSKTTNDYFKQTKQNILLPIKLWQRNYYEHIIRSEKELQETRKYIADNPINWNMDRNNPKNM
ncbi:MAG: transposase [Actinobacteria bacterium]|nr:MAG: transposase [Actinomycetota bacterium]